MASVYSVADLKANPEAIIDDVELMKEPAFISRGGTAEVMVVDADKYLADQIALKQFRQMFVDDASIKPKARA